MQLLEVPSIWEAVLDAEPGPRPVLGAAELDRALRVVADFVDVKSPYTLGHSTGVAELAQAAAAHCGLDAGQQMLVAHASLVHDLGRVGVTSAIWNAARPLTEELTLSSATRRGRLTPKPPHWRRCAGNCSTWIPTTSRG